MDMISTSSAAASDDSSSSDDEQNSEDAKNFKTAREGANKKHGPELVHRFENNASVLCLTTCEGKLFAGTQAGEILVFNLDTYQREHTIRAHHGSVLGLCLSDDKQLLFTSAGDRLIHVWNTTTLSVTATLYSLYDVGDIFCVSYSAWLRTVYMGCQNTSIQWLDLTPHPSQGSSNPKLHPSLRRDRFFDSPGPGGIRNPQQKPRSRSIVRGGARLLEIPQTQIKQFAHYGYVHCMLLATLPGKLAEPDALLITAGGDGAVCLWNLDQSQRGKPLLSARLDDDREDTASIQAMVLEGTILFTARADGEINVWDLETKQLVRVWRAFDDGILSLTLASGLLYSTSDGGEVKLFSPQYECIQSWQAHNGRVLASVFSDVGNQNLFVTGGNDNGITVWKHCRGRNGRGIARHRDEDALVGSLRTFVSFRTVSSDPKHRSECRRGASYLRSMLREFGASTEMIVTEEQHNPIVFAKFRGANTSAKNAKRVLFYGHYDVIAAENKQGKWIHDPFTLYGQDGFLYGRGASDNKGPIVAAMYAVADITRSTQLQSDIMFLIEGEEENGSHGFESAIQRHKDLIGEVDCILLANSYWINDDTPCLTYGLRGRLHATVRIESEWPDFHSGVDGSRSLDEPLKDLVMLMSQLTGPKGVINVPGFDECIRPITESEQGSYDELAQSLVKSDPKLGHPKALAESLKQRWREPSLTIHDFKTSGSEKSTIIPHSASVALSMRLVPNQDSSKIAKSLKDFLQHRFAAFRSTNNLSVHTDRTAEPWLGDPSNELFQMLERAVKDVWSCKHRRRTSLTPASPVINPSYLRHNSKATSGRRPSSLATSATLATGDFALDDEHDEVAMSISSDRQHPLSDVSVSEQQRSSKAAEDWRPLYIREGGSIPAIRFLEKEFNAPAAQLPCGQVSDHAHLENERLRVVNLFNSREIFRRVFTELSGS